MPNATTNTDVLIIGAGPVGLFLANECARRGARFRIIEQHSTQSEHSKALAIFPRTLEIFDMAGVSAPFLDIANRVTSVMVVTQGHTLAHMHFQPTQSPYSFVAMVPQDVTEKLLVEALNRKGAGVEYDTTFVSATQDSDSVTAIVDCKGHREETTAKFLVGCDGAHSTVRHLLGLPFEGAEYEDLFMLADVATNDCLPPDQLTLCPNELGPVAIFPMSATRSRIVAMVKSSEGDAPTLDFVRQILEERAPVGFEARALHWSSYFRIHHRQAARLRVGRMFIGGDAAHIHSPFGGQGMNTGLQDAWNLSWKLALTLHGHGSEQLLASYTDERRHVIKQVIETTHRMTRALGTPSKLAQTLRNAVIPMVSRLAPFQHAFVDRLSELDISYHGSPIVDGSGERYFGDSIRGGSGILNRFLLLVDNDAPPDTKKAAVALAASLSDVVEMRLESHPGMMLIRPDGYIAYSESQGHSEAGLLEIRSLLERQTQRTST